MQTVELAGLEQRLRGLVNSYEQAYDQSSLLDVLFGVQSAVEQALDIRLGLGGRPSTLTFKEKAERLLPDLAYRHRIAELCRRRDYYAHAVGQFDEREVRATAEGFLSFALDAWPALFGTVPPAASYGPVGSVLPDSIGGPVEPWAWDVADAESAQAAGAPAAVGGAAGVSSTPRRFRRWMLLALLASCTILVWGGVLLAWMGRTQPGFFEGLGIAMPALPAADGGADGEPDANGGTGATQPGFRIEAYDATWTSDRGYCLTCRIPNWAEPERPGEYEWQIQYAANQPALLRLGWCAADEETLDDNWSKMRYELIVDDHPVDVSTLALREQEVTGQVCRFYAGMLRGWTPGPHSFVWRHFIDEPINDGWENYEPGDYVLKFVVDVSNT